MCILTIAYDPEVTNEVDDIICIYLALEAFQLLHPKEEQADISDQKVTIDGVFFLCINRSCIKIRFCDPEGFFDFPKVMVCIADLEWIHIEF